MSVVVAVAAAACFGFGGRWPHLLFVAPLFCLARLWLNMLDGMVALAGGRASRRGEIFNEFPDRLSDVVIFAGIAHSGLATQAFGYWAAILALLTAYVGTLGQAVAGHREYAGVMSKQWRMFVLAAAAWVAAIARISGAVNDPLAFTKLILNGALVVIIAGCGQTICVRLARTFRRLSAADQSEERADVA
jgi:phosphatidylglycerophosphate synthase